MQSKSSVLLKILFNAFHPGSTQSFAKYLPPEEAKEISANQTTSQEPSLALSWPQDAITHAHYSWLAPLIQKMPAALQSPLIASLDKEQAHGLQKLLKIAPLTTALPPAAKKFLLAQLYQQWQPHDSIPPTYLPKSSLDVLLTFDKSQLITLIDFLAMHDLAEAIRHIVDKKYLKNIYLCLSPQKQQFLRQCLHKKEKLAAPKLDIHKWDGSNEKLNQVLHRRGMLRLGKSLCGQGRHFLWHIAHTLDIGRGQVISQYYLSDEIPGITPLLVQQVFSVINFLKPKSNA